MANIHIRTVDGSEVATIMHFAVPAANNAAGVGWQVIAAQVFGKTVLPDGDGTAGTISAAEKAAIVAGSVTVPNPVGKALVALNAAMYAADKSDRMGALRVRLRNEKATATIWSGFPLRLPAPSCERRTSRRCSWGRTWRMNVAAGICPGFS